MLLVLPETVPTLAKNITRRDRKKNPSQPKKPQPVSEIATVIWLAQWLSANREKLGSCRHISDLFPGVSGVFDKNTVEHHPELDCEHASVIKTKQN